MTLKSVFKIGSLAISLMFIVFIGGCSKNKYSKLEGIWNKVNVVDSSGIVREQWSFSSDRKLVISIRNNANEFAPYDNGTYEITAKIDKTEMLLSGFFNNVHYNGTWQVMDLSKETLFMVMPGDGGRGLNTIEFTKLQ
jgi:hypothetical protein